MEWHPAWSALHQRLPEATPTVARESVGTSDARHGAPRPAEVKYATSLAREFQHLAMLALVAFNQPLDAEPHYSAETIARIRNELNAIDH
jgi:hypothetical protein